MEADILQLAARAYQKLMTVEYQVVLGRKGKAHTIEIAFRADNFYHLAGLHKLKQRYPFQQQTSKWVLDHILRGTISMSSFSKDQNFYKVEERLHALCIFEKVLDSNQTQFFLYDRRKVSFATKIMANYLAKGHIENELILFFFSYKIILGIMSILSFLKVHMIIVRSRCNLRFWQKLKFGMRGVASKK